MPPTPRDQLFIALAADGVCPACLADRPSPWPWVVAAALAGWLLARR